MLKSDSPVAARIASAMKSGIKVVACENTLAAQKLAKADMLPDIGYVPAGVVELMKKQQQGYAYIRP
jgi:intracellular sulfur oxidation DsrE/DsrF family protein